MAETTTTIPEKCWAAVVKNEGPDFYVDVEQVPTPKPGHNEVLVKINATGLCLTDIHFMLQDWSVPKMSDMGTRSAGHEGSGVIVELGQGVTKFSVGQRVGYKPLQDVCHECEYCKDGREAYCKTPTFGGLQLNGSFQQYVVCVERYIVTIPDGVSDYVAGPIMCSASTVYSSLRESGLKAGQWAVFPGGGGGVGIQGVQLAVAMGMRPIVVDTGGEREALAKQHGAEHFIDFQKEDPVKSVLEITGGGGHGVFVTGVQAYPLALQYIGSRAGAKVMCIGLPPKGRFHMDVDPTQLVLLNQSIHGTFVGGKTDIEAALEYARKGQLKLQPTVVGRSQFNDSIQKLRKGLVAGRIVVDFNRE